VPEAAARAVAPAAFLGERPRTTPEIQTPVATRSALAVSPARAARVAFNQGGINQGGITTVGGAGGTTSGGGGITVVGGNGGTILVGGATSAAGSNSPGGTAGGATGAGGRQEPRRHDQRGRLSGVEQRGRIDGCQVGL